MEESGGILKTFSLYREFLAQREEILKHKWIESEKAGYDVGFETALVDWVMKYRSKWLKYRRLERNIPEYLKQDYIRIALFKDPGAFFNGEILPIEDYHGNKKLLGVQGFYKIREQTKMEKFSIADAPAIPGGIFISECSDEDIYRVHFRDNLELSVLCDKEGDMRIVSVKG